MFKNYIMIRALTLIFQKKEILKHCHFERETLNTWWASSFILTRKEYLLSSGRFIWFILFDICFGFGSSAKAYIWIQRHSLCQRQIHILYEQWKNKSEGFSLLKRVSKICLLIKIRQCWNMWFKKPLKPAIKSAWWAKLSFTPWASAHIITTSCTRV